MTSNLFYIKDGSITQTLDSNSVFEGCVDFCQQWVKGQDNFTINTSGSTGTPKPINISRNQMEASAKMTIQALSLQPEDNALICLNTSYIAGKMMLVRGMVGKLNMYVIEPSSNPLTEIPQNLQIDFMAVVPLQLETMIDSREPGINQLNKIKAVIVGGAPISLALAEKIKTLKCPIYATYGMTETVSHIALKNMNGAGMSDYFKTFDDVQIGLDSRGCLTINSVLTNHQTIITNDMVDIVDDNTFEWLGRADHVINSGGLKIHPEQLENKIRPLLDQQGINCNLIIVGIPDESLGEKVVLILETKAMTSNVIQSIKSVFKEGLPPYHLPKEIYQLGKFVYTETGKVKRKETAGLISEDIR